jgi:hypothetical protein
MEGGYDANDIYTLINEFDDTHDRRILDVIRQLWTDSNNLFVARDEDGVTPFQYAVGLDHTIADFIFELVKTTFPNNPRLVAEKLLLDNVDDINTTALLNAMEDLPMAEKIMELGIAIGDPSAIAWEHEDEDGVTA